MRMLGLFIELGSDGGVQRMGRHSALVMSRYCRERSDECSLVSFADPAGPGEVEICGERLAFRGFGGSKAALIRHLLACGADCIYTNHLFLAPAVRLRRLVRPHMPYGIHMHGVEAWSPMSATRRAAARAANLITATSRHTGLETVRHQGVRRECVTVLYPAMEPTAGSSPAVLPPPARPYLLTVARLGRNDALKQVDLSIRAFGLLAGRFPGWDYRIVGDGSDVPRLRELALQTGHGDQIHFEGRISDAELAVRYKQATFFVLPSIKEGLGIVFIEAMWQGLPAIGANVGGIPEVVLHGETGLLLNENSPEALAGLMTRLMEDPEARRAMGERARHHVRTRFSFAEFEQRFRLVLNALTDRLLSDGPEPL